MVSHIYTVTMTDYIVDSGNWKVRVSIDTKHPSPYMEAATQAAEAVFGMKELNSQCELISLVDNVTQIDYFSPDCDAPYPPTPMFSLVTMVCKAKDLHKPDTFIPFLTSKVFENAAQCINVQYAREAESQEPDKVKQFLKLQKKLEKIKTRKKKH